MRLPSRFQIGDKVSANIMYDSSRRNGVVKAVIFTKSKVFYDFAFRQNNKRYSEIIDSSLVESTNKKVK